MPDFSIGGQAKTDFFRVKKNEAGDGYDILNKLTDVVAAAPTLATDVAQSVTLVSSTDVQPQEDGTVKINLEQYDAGEDMYKFFDKVAVPSTTIARPEKKLENGKKYGGTSGSGDLLLAITYLQYDDDNLKTKIFTYYSLGRLSPTSGSQKTDPENYIQPSCEYTSIAGDFDLTIPVGCFDATLVTPAAKTLPKTRAFKREFIAVAA